MNVATIDLKLFFPRQFIFPGSLPFSRTFNKIIKFQYFSRTGKTVVIFPGFPGSVGTLASLLYHAKTDTENCDLLVQVNQT